MTTTLDGFTLGRTLGQGFSAKVKHATAHDGKVFAIKIFRLNNQNFLEEDFRRLKNEVEATMLLEHDHVVKYYEFKERAIMHKRNGDQV